MRQHVYVWAATALAVFGAPVSAWANGYQGGGGYGHMWGGGYPGMFFGPLIWTLVIAAVVVLVVLLVRRSGCRCHHWKRYRRASGGKAALDILSERFARGEIEAADYQERKRLLEEEE